MSRRPPSVGRWLVALGVPPADRGEVLGDLLEGYRRVLARRGRARARLWYLREAASFAVAGAPGRLRSTLGLGWSPGDDGWAVALADDAAAGLRSLRRAPRFTLAAVATLALGIGGTTAVASVVGGVLLRPLPFAEPERLVAILDTFQDGRWWSSAPGSVVAWREGSRTLEGVAWAQGGRRTLLWEGEPREVAVQRISAGFLELLGVEPARGRSFRREDERVEGAPVVVVSDALRARLAAGGPLVGRTLVLDEVAHTVVGVLPPGAELGFLGPHELLLPRRFTEDELHPGGRIVQAVGRLAPGVAPAAAAEELSAMVAANPEGSEGWGVDVVPLHERVVGDVRAPLLVLLGAVTALLMVACVNVANLLLARGSARRRELAVRRALGASRLRLARGLLVEALLLSAAGGAAGALLATWGVDALLALAPDSLPRAGEVAAEPRMLAVAAGVSILTGLAFGAVPALRAVADADAPALRTGSSGRGSGDALRSLFVSLETAFVLVLLTGAGLMLASVQNLREVDPGFPVSDRLALELTLPAATHPDTRSVSRFFQELAERVRGLPGVEAAGVVTHLPLAGDDWSAYHIVEGRPARSGEEPVGGMEAAGPGYFEALGVPLVEGRTFTDHDLGGDEPVVVVDQAMVTRYWPDRSPLGERVRMSTSGPLAEWHEVVGVVGAVRYWMDQDPRPRLYLPDDRIPFDAQRRTLVVRAAPGRVEAVEGSVREALRQVAPRVAVGSLRRMEEAARGSLADQTFRTVLLLAFATVGLLLGAVGIHGVVSFTVSRRTREVGVRMALGARPPRVLGRFVARAMVPVLVGLGVGLGVVGLLGRAVRGTLFAVEATDPVVLATVTAVLLAVALASAAGPGLRATRIDPVRALRAD